MLFYVRQALHMLGEKLMKATGMGGVCLNGAAGSHGELAGLFVNFYTVLFQP